jgi:hypothetical protein
MFVGPKRSAWLRMYAALRRKGCSDCQEYTMALFRSQSAPRQSMYVRRSSGDRVSAVGKVSFRCAACDIRCIGQLWTGRDEDMSWLGVGTMLLGHLALLVGTFRSSVVIHVRCTTLKSHSVSRLWKQRCVCPAMCADWSRGVVCAQLFP